MISHYVLIALQNLRKYPGYSAIKILSLAVGLVCSLLVLMHLQYINSYDKHIPNWQNTYRLVADFNAAPVIHTDISADLYAPRMALDYPGIDRIARMQPAGGLFARGDVALPNGFHWVDPDLPRLFSLRFLAGDAAGALAQPNSVVLSETAARKYFAEEDPLGRTLTFDGRADLVVTGVFADMPENTHVLFEILIAVETGRGLFGEDFMAGSDWMDFTETRTYLSFPDRAAAREVEADLSNFIARNFPTAQREYAENRQLVLSLEPLADIYLSPRRGLNEGVDTHASAVYFLSAIAAIVLLTSCMNFANLSISQLRHRSRELGVKKALGAQRAQIAVQLLFESLLQMLLALLIALPIVVFLTPYYTAIIGSSLGVAFTPDILLESENALSVLLFVLATGILSGLVPAVVLSRQKPALILKDRGASGGSRYLRPLVTAVQFTFASAFIMIAVGSYRQMEYMTGLDIGFEESNLIVIDTGYDPADPGRFNHAALRNELARHPGIVALGAADAAPPSKGVNGAWRLAGSAEDDVRLVRHYTVDPAFIEAMGFELLAGRIFHPDYGTDFLPTATEGSPGDTGTQGVRSIVITRNALRNFGFSSPESALDALFQLEGDTYRVIGVIDDYYVMGAIVGSLPLANVLRATNEPLRYFMLRIDPAQSRAALDHIDAVWQRHRPDVPLNRPFYETRYRFVLDSWRTPIMSTTIFASVITILISICGLYALAYYSTQRRTKEVGVRKVLGASRVSLVALLTWDFVKPVLAASAIACLGAYYAIRWIHQLFVFSQDIPYWLYAGVTALTLAVAMATVGTFCFRTASANPVKSLRYE